MGDHASRVKEGVRMKYFKKHISSIFIILFILILIGILFLVKAWGGLISIPVVAAILISCIMPLIEKLEEVERRNQ